MKGVGQICAPPFQLLDINPKLKEKGNVPNIDIKKI
jgi:hypothetical protein